MSNERKHSKLDELIRELCPDGVEFTLLKNVAEIGTGSSNGNEAVDEGAFPFFIRSQTVKAKNEWEYDEEAIIIPGEGGIGDIFHYVNGKYALHQRVYRIHFLTEKINVKFAYYCMTANFKKYITKKAVSATVTSIRKPMIETFAIPVPPLPVQREIVRILDKFTELTAALIAALTAELTARKKQYGYYRNKLLSFENETSMQALGDVCDVVAGGTPSKKNSDYWNGGTIKWLGSTVCQNRKTVDDVTDYITEQGLAESSAKVMKAGSTLIALVGATIGKTAYLPFEAAINQNIAGIYPKDTTMLDPSYVYYACTTLYSKFLALTQGSKLAMANISFVRSLQIPIPSLQVQKRLVQVLDNFDAICSDLKIGLPAEIEARKKQYEFYREKLLAFHEISN